MSASKNDKLVIYQIFTRLFGNRNTTNKVYGTIDENGSGKFNDITDAALTSIKDLGVTHLWYTGILEHATLSDYSAFGITPDHPLIVKGIAGSPYAVKDYYDVDPDLAENVPNRMQEFEALVKRTQNHNLKVIIDFIPNHVARQYHSDCRPDGIDDFGEKDDTGITFSPQNNFYYIPNQDFIVPEGHKPPVTVTGPYLERPAKATGNDVFQAQPSQYDWYETIKLNYGVDYLSNGNRYFDPIPSTWLKMYDILAFWVNKGIDGFRCDMAEMVPVEFWGWVIRKIKTLNPDIIFIAEIYNPYEYHNYITNGLFDYLYDKVGLYNSLRKLVEGYGTVEDITRIWQQESGDISRNMLRFLENHDEQRIASRYFAGDPWLVVPAITLSATLHTGPFMLYFGQELGVDPNISEGFQGEDGRTTIFDYWGIPEMQQWINVGQFDTEIMDADKKALRDFYQKLNRFITENEAVADGEFYDLQYVNIDGQSPNYDKTRIYSYLRYTGNQKLLFVYNFDRNRYFETNVRIPQGAWTDTLGLKSTSFYKLKPVFPLFSPMPSVKADVITSTGIQLTLPPVSAQVFEIIGE
ncbi:Alpha-1,4-glucan:maltose-1-phosphate maltosyltransferase [Dyadobacter sp. CECT 9275]|uniref:Alpha-1,4-glucan:maltose-1-phosphate maltosyltransferase n=1 Tax=Dyadobacter helix TaxID=2822344 RepID=A0A916JHH3_9BACT|nr:alpha-amylase family protein [Dyadobacter sp. CECT 9275]CAG5004344.1 Alpha-1,4-glucan:maltose-1-phosphate maltosyltransferase [Dyadobacter sp. CECT 9275]